MPYLKHELGKTFYTCKGRKNKKNKPLIFLHGGPGGLHDPKSPLFKLASTRKVIMYDQIGGGKSSPLNRSDMTIKTFVDELAQLVNHLGLNEFHLAGGSWGTTLALEYYLKMKGVGVASLIFQSPMFSATIWENDALDLIKKMSSHDQKIIHYCHEIKATDSKVYEEVMFRYYLKHVLRDKSKLDAFMKVKNDNGKKVYEYMWGPSEFKPTGMLKNYERLPSLSTITIPSLFICGEHDEATPKSTALFASKVNFSKQKVIKAASHAILKEQPEAMLDVISDFLRELEAEW
jgi:proline iminopeptidase